MVKVIDYGGRSADATEVEKETTDDQEPAMRLQTRHSAPPGWRRCEVTSRVASWVLPGDFANRESRARPGPLQLNQDFEALSCAIWTTSFLNGSSPSSSA